MLGEFLIKGKRRVINTDDFNELWEEISKFKGLNESKAEESQDLICLQDSRGRMLLLALYDTDHWALETLEKDWNTLFGKIDLAGEFDVKEVLMNDEELKTTLEKPMTERKASP